MNQINLANINTSTIRPGYLVSLKTTISGGVKYRTKVLQGEQIDKEGTLTERWETDKTVINAEEHDAAVKARQKCRTLITGSCINTAFALLCPDVDYPDFEEAVKEAREVAKEFNSTSKYSRLSINIIVGKIAQDDVDAMRTINSEVSELMQKMQEGLSNLDVKTVRDAAAEAKKIGGMLSVDAQAKVNVAVELARKTARRMVSDAADKIKVKVDKVTMRKIEEQRTAFLDLSDDADDVAAPEAEVRAVDLSV